METKNLKPFDLEAAKAGAPVVTRNGRPVRILCTDLRCGKYPVVAAVMSHDEEIVEIYSANGELYCGAKNDNDLDLFMAPTKCTGWVNIYIDKFDDRRRCVFFKTKKVAEELARSRADCVATVPVEWEE